MTRLDAIDVVKKAAHAFFETASTYEVVSRHNSYGCLVYRLEKKKD